MRARHITKLLASWTAAWSIGGAVIGVVMAFRDTGHVGFFGTILLLVTAGFMFGFVSGAVFAPLFTWIAPRLTARPFRSGVAAVVGAIAGAIGIFVADTVVGVTHAFVIGSLAGAMTGLVCGAFPVSERWAPQDRR